MFAKVARFNNEPFHQLAADAFPLVMLAAATLAGASFAAWSIEPLAHGDNSGQLRPAGTVSVSGASNLDDLQSKLAEKARQEGAKGYTVDSASGDNKMFGTATIYK
jgi:MqsR-controlled colanic acid and biofilm protein A